MKMVTVTIEGDADLVQPVVDHLCSLFGEAAGTYGGASVRLLVSEAPRPIKWRVLPLNLCVTPEALYNTLGTLYNNDTERGGSPYRFMWAALELVLSPDVLALLKNHYNKLNTANTQRHRSRSFKPSSTSDDLPMDTYT